MGFWDFLRRPAGPNRRTGGEQCCPTSSRAAQKPSAAPKSSSTPRPTPPRSAAAQPESQGPGATPAETTAASTAASSPDAAATPPAAASRDSDQPSGAPSPREAEAQPGAASSSDTSSSPAHPAGEVDDSLNDALSALRNFEDRHGTPAAASADIPDVSQAIAEFYEATTRDEFLPMFNVAEARRFRTITRAAIAEIGYEADMFGDHARTAHGVEIGFWNLASTCADAPHGHSQWPALIRTHMRKLRLTLDTAASTSPDEEITREELEHQLLVHLVPEDYLANFDGQAEYALEWMNGTRTMLVLDGQDSITLLTGEILTTLGPLGPLFDRGIRNLRQSLPSMVVERETVQQQGGSFLVLDGDSMHLGSTAVILPDALHQWMPDADTSRGVLFSVPTRSMLFLQPLATTQNLVMTLRLMGAYTIQCHREDHAPLSPHLYLWRDGTITALTEFGEDGRVGINPGPLRDDLGDVEP